MVTVLTRTRQRKKCLHARPGEALIIDAACVHAGGGMPSVEKSRVALHFYVVESHMKVHQLEKELADLGGPLVLSSTEAWDIEFTHVPVVE